MNLDIAAGVRVTFYFLLIAAFALIFSAWRTFREARDLKFFLKRQQLLMTAWRFLLGSLAVVFFAVILKTYGEPAIYQVYEPSPSPSLFPTVTMTLPPTEIPTQTQTPLASPTSEFTPAPVLPAAISAGITNTITPNPDASFSTITFSRRIGGNLQPINPNVTFKNPIDIMYGTFSYDKMVRGSQWTAMWFQEGKLVCIETLPWDGAAGGYGYTECTLPPDEWKAGTYEVQIFVGSSWKVTGSFIVEGDPPTPTPSPSPSPSPSPTSTFTVTFTSTPSNTPIPTATKISTSTPASSVALIPSLTTVPTTTSSPTATRTPTRTPTPFPSRTPTPTPTSVGVTDFFYR